MSYNMEYYCQLESVNSEELKRCRVLREFCTALFAFHLLYCGWVTNRLLEDG